MVNEYIRENNMPQYPEPFWRDTVQIPKFSALNKDIAVDVAVVGGGITGITTAYLLMKEGLKVAIIEAGVLFNGTTGHTTAKVTAQHGLIYDEFIQHFGVDRTRLYYEANNEALQFVQKTINELNIDCDFTNEDAYVYTNEDTYVNKLEKEKAAYDQLGIHSDFVHTLPFDLKIKSAVVMKNQGQFHPLKYLKVLVEEFVKGGGLIFENTTAIDVDHSDKPIVMTRNGHKVSCQYVCACTHFPFYDGLGFYPTRMYSERSYLIAIKANRDIPGGMYINAEQPTRSVRYTMMRNEKILIIGGENHKTGQGIPTIQHYEALEEFADTTFGIQNYLYRWSAQDLTTLDKIPYIGHITSGHKRVLVATGFRKWGMTNSTAAALLLRDIIKEKKNQYEELFSPSRFEADPSIKKFISTNMDVAKHFVEGKLEYPLRDINDLSNDEGAVVRVNGDRAGAYKDEQGKLHIVNTTCTHLGCEVEWNSGDRTWDCPCHGSRFTINGDVLEGPAEKPLKQVKVEE